MIWPSFIAVRPISTWPTTRTPASKRVRSQFSAPLSTTLDLLQRELRALRAHAVTAEIAIPAGEQNWRQDGRPRAGAQADHPGVVLAFRSPLVPGRELRYAADRFATWESNLRAIALGLESLRRLERYGIANRGEQYAGWAQLPSGSMGPNADRGRELIRKYGDLVTALKATHPDHGGTDRDFADVMAARSGGSR